MHGLDIQDNLGDLVGKSLCQVQIKEERKGNLRSILWVMNQIVPLVSFQRFASLKIGMQV